MSAPIAFNRLVPELNCSDFARSLAFYCETLGFARLYGRDDPAFACLEREGAQLMLEELADGPNGSWRTGAMERPFGRGINLQIETADLDALLRALTRAGWPLYRAPETAWYRVGDRLEGQRQFLVQDPDGYLLRFCQDAGTRPIELADAGARTVR